MGSRADMSKRAELALKNDRRLGERLRDIARTARAHLPEYLMEAAGLGIFMISACLFSIALFHQQSSIVSVIANDNIRRAMMGIAMGLTAIGIIYSPWGKQSGAHLNPAVTLTFLRLGKISRVDAAFYVFAQVIGGLLGVVLLLPIMKGLLADQGVNYTATVPGMDGVAVAWLAEFVISFLLMIAVLVVSNRMAIASKTGIVAGIIVALNIYFAAPISGMSMNPARTMASAIPSGIWTSAWVYFTAPALAMLLAAQTYLWIKGRQDVFCAKLHHQNSRRCIFCETHAKQSADNNR